MPKRLIMALAGLCCIGLFAPVQAALLGQSDERDISVPARKSEIIPACPDLSPSDTTQLEMIGKIDDILGFSL